ncbi:hypothetical protein QE152_g14254 [Popillia japonica]|uniref:Uncharacterized protein n=1 Tax=Popillia japonica TaxID=7064 RepID=A0AAW1L9A6_POPJA
MLAIGSYTALYKDSFKPNDFLTRAPLSEFILAGAIWNWISGQDLLPYFVLTNPNPSTPPRVLIGPFLRTYKSQPFNTS